MFFSEPLREKRIANGTRKWDVYDPAVMHMPNFRLGETELTSSKAMRVDGNPGPRCNSVFQLVQQQHKAHTETIGCLSVAARFIAKLALCNPIHGQRSAIALYSRTLSSSPPRTRATVYGIPIRFAMTAIMDAAIRSHRRNSTDEFAVISRSRDGTTKAPLTSGRKR